MIYNYNEVIILKIKKLKNEIKVYQIKNKPLKLLPHVQLNNIRKVRKVEMTRKTMSPIAHARMIMKKTMKEKGLTSTDVNNEFMEIRYGKKI